ncbi:MAG: CapA family protein [Lachnospiraceae bacterium]|nr:CapA family protein [Lachnospiraceae bacterium]MBQ2250295.1 CapA family protein [Lachnospiraceae bacterium]MBR0306147.1 CapA family protein [Lachnospiraceae bacterium]
MGKLLKFLNKVCTIRGREETYIMKKVKKWMLGILAATTVVATGCGNHTDMVSVAVIKGVDSAEHVSAAAEAETTEAIRIELATEAVKETAEPETTAPAEPEIEDITLLFAGDVYLSQHVLGAYDKAGGIHGVLDEGIRAEIDAADIFMVNQEFPFTERGTKAEDKQYTFRLPHDRLHIMNEMGIDIVTLANNHILDFGPHGITDSIAALKEAGIKYVGAGEDLEEAKKLEIIEVGGRKIGFLGTSRVYMATSWAAGENHPGVFSTYDPTLPVEEIKKADELVDYLVVYVHWGVERETTPKEYQRVMGRQYIDAGADIVIGSHPHVLQPLEYYNDKPIMFSMGNFVFGSSIPSTELLKIEIHADDSMTVTEIPCTSSGGFTRLK